MLRPLILVPAWAFYALGAHSAPDVVLATVLADTGFWCLSAVLACAYVLNQIFDRDSDALNDKGHYLTRGLFGMRTMVAIALVCFAAASLLYQRVVPGQRFPIVLAFLLATTYSLPPLRFCARPYFDLAANALGYGGLAFVIGATGHGDYFADAWRNGIPWVFLVGATFLHTTILDVDGDAATGKRTTTVAVGVRVSAWVAVLFALGALGDAAFSFLERGTRAFPVLVTLAGFLGFVTAAIFIERAQRMGPVLMRAARARASSLAVQWMTVIVALTAVLRDPLMLLLLLPVLVAARAYYRARFGLAYPG
ncbi:MAG: UbiA family prenyltransferase [Candidatus Krumholzibacteria bacterium]|nr:UbiA family prenyltransferase [Candidatus Krumholzibacteria bacterium]MDH4337484.1 UbiA family prenyltransferase [Candidatus Krumholzibacteria bacterium]MDH5268299.1 UbiA family prenyltransferase [Candidatus Krumholzibacteria bacterium]